MTRCTSCGAPIVWAKTISGARVPLNEQVLQVVAGTFSANREARRTVIDHWGVTHVGLLLDSDAGREAINRPPLENGYTPRIVEGREAHFASCPNAKQHRKRGGKRGGA